MYEGAYVFARQAGFPPWPALVCCLILLVFNSALWQVMPLEVAEKEMHYRKRDDHVFVHFIEYDTRT
jgi:hypothetical protein